MIYAKNYENIFKFVQVNAYNTVDSFFRTRSMYVFRVLLILPARFQNALA